MRNASKNTIKRVLRLSIRSKTEGICQNAYYLFNEVGAQIWRTSKGKICNRALILPKKYKQYFEL